MSTRLHDGAFLRSRLEGGFHGGSLVELKLAHNAHRLMERLVDVDAHLGRTLDVGDLQLPRHVLGVHA